MDIEIGSLQVEAAAIHRHHARRQRAGILVVPQLRMKEWTPAEVLERKSGHVCHQNSAPTRARRATSKRRPRNQLVRRVAQFPEERAEDRFEACLTSRG